MGERRLTLMRACPPTCPDYYAAESAFRAAWNAWREGMTLQTLSWRAEGCKAEPFPEAN